MRTLGFALCLALCPLGLMVGASGCDDTFEAPARPDLYKVPYDFGLLDRDGGPDLAVPDEGTPADLHLENHPDLTTPPDLTRPTDA